MDKRHGCSKLCYIVSVIVLCCTSFLTCEEVDFISINGTFIIGGMFPIHALTGGAKCASTINDQNGIQNLEAFLFARDRVNKEILKNIGKL